MSVPQNALRLLDECRFKERAPETRDKMERDDAIHDADDPERL
jgi:hypothetical protein